MPLGSKWWQRPNMGQLAGPQPGAPRPVAPQLGEAAPILPFSPSRPLDPSGAPSTGSFGRLGNWFPDEAELRTWGGAQLIEQEATAIKEDHLPGARLVQARFPLPLPVLLSVGATSPLGAVPWVNCPVIFRVQIGVAAGQHTFVFATANPIAGPVFTLSGQLAARAIQVDAFFTDVTAVAISANVWAGVAPFG